MAAVGGSLFALIHAMLCLKFKANQVISGVVVNILAMALTAYLTKLFNRVVFGATSDKFVLTVSSRITIPGISKIPVLGAYLPICILLTGDCGSGFRGVVCDV